MLKPSRLLALSMIFFGESPPFITSCEGTYALSSSLSDADAAHFNISPQEKADFMEEVTTELSVYLGMLYHMVEVFKGHDDFADELSEQCRLPPGYDADPFVPCISEPGTTFACLSFQCRCWPP